MLSRILPVVLFAAATASGLDTPPRFGTVLQFWSLRMSGPYAGAGVTWRRDDNRLYLMDKYTMVWKLDPEDPLGTLEAVPSAFANLGRSDPDLPIGFAWDSDSACFWLGHVVDQDTSGVCCLLRYVWNGDSWFWPGTARDSWTVGDSLNSGALQCLYLGGIEKSARDGLFYAAPVHTSPSVLNYVVRFDPYTRTNRGRVSHGDQNSELGCALIPWDSSYILTCGWNADNYVKRDSTGHQLAATSATHGPADWSLYVPQLIDPEDTVCVYCIHSNIGNYLKRISTGMLWAQLPSAFEPGVRPVKILAPFGVVDSGETVVPTLVVRNTGQETADTVDIHFIVDNEMDRVIYHDSTRLLNMPPLSDDTVAFTPWVPVGRDSVGCMAWTFWSGDSNVHDDTIASGLLIRVRDVGITEVYSPLPGDTIDPEPFSLSCEVFNFGNQTVSFLFLAWVHDVPFQDTFWVTNLLAGGARTAGMPFPIALAPGLHWCTMACPLQGDLHPENNDTTYWFYVRGLPPEPDVGVDSIPVPIGTMDTLPFTPQARYANYGSQAASCTTYCWIEDDVTDSILYSDKEPVMLMARTVSTVAYRPCTLKLEGQYMVSCSLHIDGDVNPDNDVLHQVFWVASGAGIAGQPKVKLAGELPEPTVVRGVLWLGQSGDRPSPGGTVPVLLLDPAGRVVMHLHPGENDISRLAPGVYFLRPATTIRRVVVAR